VSRFTYDTFLLNDELDMLECRLEELDGKVDFHVLVESPLDHQGNPKPLYYAEQRYFGTRFARWHDRIINVTAELPSFEEDPNPWSREFAMRQAVWQGLGQAGARADDLVLVCDVDEIPSDTAVSMKPDGVVALNMRLAMFAVDWVYPEQTRIAVAGRVRDLAGKPLFSLRDNGVRARLPLVSDAGWHFTWLGGPQAIARKARQFCHLELQAMIEDGNAAGEWYEQGWTWHGPSAVYPPPRRSFRLDPVEVDEAWPAYIRDRRCPQDWFRPR
jgi:hypothetical protein